MAELRMRQAREHDLQALEEIRAAAFAPIFASFRALLGDSLYEVVQAREDEVQSELLASLLSADSPWRLYVAEVGGQAVGFLSYQLHQESRIGEIGQCGASRPGGPGSWGRDVRVRAVAYEGGGHACGNRRNRRRRQPCAGTSSLRESRVFKGNPQCLDVPRAITDAHMARAKPAMPNARTTMSHMRPGGKVTGALVYSLFTWERAEAMGHEGSHVVRRARSGIASLNSDARPEPLRPAGPWR